MQTPAFTPVLHHYPNSPFAEKIRAIFGYKNLDWCSVIAPDIMPKPDLQALTGGYRRVPVLQIGADIYCDTALIANVIDELSPAKSLYPKEVAGAAHLTAQWADHFVFWAAMGYNFQPAGVAQLFANAQPEMMKAFAEDRKAMGSKRKPPFEAAGEYKAYLRGLNNMLEQGESLFLFGNAPTIADFAAYHPLWFTQTRTPSLATIFDATPIVKQWLSRMARFSALGKERMQPFSIANALDIAKNAQPVDLSTGKFCDEHGIALGDRVSIAAESFGTETSEGELVAATQNRYVIRRVDPNLGILHVHFPRIGFNLKAV